MKQRWIRSSVLIPTLIRATWLKLWRKSRKSCTRKWDRRWGIIRGIGSLSKWLKEVTLKRTSPEGLAPQQFGTQQMLGKLPNIIHTRLRSLSKMKKISPGERRTNTRFLTRRIKLPPGIKSSKQMNTGINWDRIWRLKTLKNLTFQSRKSLIWNSLFLHLQINL